MQIIPKICEYDYNTIDSRIRDQIEYTHKCEIQMLQGDLGESFQNVKRVIESLGDCLEYVSIHLPFSALYIELLYCNKDLKEQYIKLIHDIVDLADELGIDIDIVSHVNPNKLWIEHTGTLEFIRNILNKLVCTRVGLLIENSIICLNDDDDAETSEEYIFRVLNHGHLGFCLDLCHLQASENVFKKSRSLSEGQLKNLKNIHFSATLDRDGYKDKKRTHGRKHPNRFDMAMDIKYLESKGIKLDNINIVAEINEEDYENRPDLISEIEMFNELYDSREI